VAYAVTQLAALGRPINVGFVYAQNRSVFNNMQLGINDGFAFTAISTNSGAALLNSTPGDVVTIPRSDLQGVLPWLFDWLATTGNVSFTFSAVAMPPALVSSSDDFAKTLWVLNNATALNGAPFDIAGVLISTNPGRQWFVRMVPVLTFGYQLVGPRPYVLQKTFSERAWVWTQPFSANVWIVYGALIVMSSLIMSVFEHERESHDEDPRRHRHSFQGEEMDGRHEVMQHSLYLATMGATLKEMYDPTTSAGRIYTSTKAFVIFLLMSIYVANLASFFTTENRTSQPIQSIADFETTGIPMCMRNNSNQATWLNNTYPTLANSGLVITTAAASLSAVQAAVSGTCGGALIPSTDALYELGAAGDPNGVLCGMEPLGPVLWQNQFSLPITGNMTLFPTAFSDAITRLISYAVSQGNFSAGAIQAYLPFSRPVCDQAAAANAKAIADAKSGTLELPDVAGLFIVLAAAMILSTIVHFQDLWLQPIVRGVKTALSRSRASKPAESASGEEAAEASSAKAPDAEVGPGKVH